MKIRMIEMQCGPDGPIEAGTVLDVDPVWGRDMINGGHAEEVIDEPAEPAASDPAGDRDTHQS